MLFDPLEEGLNLSSFSIKFGNGYCVNREVFCEEAIDLAITNIFIHNEPEIVRILPVSIKSDKLYRLIVYKSHLSINLSGLKTLYNMLSLALETNHVWF